MMRFQRSCNFRDTHFKRSFLQPTKNFDLKDVILSEAKNLMFFLIKKNQKMRSLGLQSHDVAES
jgi:hypothetical protein